MNHDCLKLTTYFGLRDRSDDGLIADVLLNVYSRVKLETSVLLLGAEGFGLKRHLRSDLHVDLCGNLPLVSVAIDTPAQIESAVEAVMEIQHHGLLTLEPGRMLTEKLDVLALHGTTKLTVFVRHREEALGRPALLTICDLLYRRGLTGATVLRGVDGTVGGERKRARGFSTHREVPVMVSAIGRGDQIEAVVPELIGLLRRPLLTLERVHICKRDGHLLAHPASPPQGATEHRGSWQTLMVYASEAGKGKSSPIHSPLIRRLRARRSTAGATSLRGVRGFHNDRFPQGNRSFQLRHRVPMVTTMIDSPQGIARAFGVVDELTTDRGLVTSETVVALR